uniref:TLC domain-containing protein n=1 Tax=Macrostomum lignano TaxID=282301 RepID=A0A1I8G9G7_9PLAT
NFKLRLAAATLGHTGPTLVAMATAITLLCGIPAVQHIATRHLFAKTEVDFATCAGCACWDTISVGSRETPGQHAYHSVYWNSNGCTLAMYCLTVLQALLCYKAVESLTCIVMRHGLSKLRPAFVCLTLLNIYPNYYSWWSYLMYLNEKTPMYSLIRHHMYFYASELIVAALVLHLCNVESAINRVKLSIVFCLAASHLVSGFADHYLFDPASAAVRASRLASFMHHSRNAGLMLPDLAHVLVSGRYLQPMLAKANTVEGLQLESPWSCWWRWAILLAVSMLLFCVSQAL